MAVRFAAGEVALDRLAHVLRHGKAEHARVADVELDDLAALRLQFGARRASSPRIS